MLFNRPESIYITPSLIIGCGGSGTLTTYWVKELAKKIIFNNDEQRLQNFSPVKFLVIDTSRQLLEQEGKEHGLDTIQIASKNLTTIIKDPSYPSAGSNKVRSIKTLFPDANYQMVLDDIQPELGAATCPPIGRMNFLDSWENIYSQLAGIISNSWPVEDIQYGFDVKRDFYQIFIIASLYGGTGAGTYLDLSACLRKILKDKNFQHSVSIYGIFYLPNFVASDICEANAYACLKELNHFCSNETYRLIFGDGHELKISNIGNDVLFNKVFLIGKRNTEEVDLDGIDLATQMVAKLVFSWVFTRIGETINKRIVDQPNQFTNRYVPENGPKRRISAFSSFGIATAFIPYEEIKVNLAVELAKAVLQELLAENIEQGSKAFSFAYEKETILRRLGLEKSSLSSSVKITIPPLLRALSLEDISRSEGISYDQAISKVRETTNRWISSIRELVRNKKKIQDAQIRRFEEEIENIKEEFQNFGMAVCTRVINEIESYIENMKSEIEKNISDFNLEQAIRGVESLIVQLRRISQKSLIEKVISALKGDTEETERAFTSIKQKVQEIHDKVLLTIIDGFLENCRLKLEQTRKKMEYESGRVHEIFRLLNNKKRSYDRNTTEFCPIPSDIIEKYIETKLNEFNPTSLAEDIRNRPLKNGTLPFNKFDENPEEAADALFEYCLKEVEKFISKKLSFSKSEFFPLSSETAQNFLGEWSTRAYQKTWNETVKRSSPFIEYQDGLGFQTYKQTFVILPSCDEEEKRKWESVAHHECDIMHKFEGIFPDNITVIQFHYGFPIYAIGRSSSEEGMTSILKWRKKYEYQKSNGRPVDKFNIFMEDPYINITSRPKQLSKEEIEELYDWALEISKSYYPIFVYQEDGHYLNDVSNPEVRDFYFNSNRECYIKAEQLKDILNNDLQFKEVFLNILRTYANNMPDKQYGSQLNSLITGVIVGTRDIEELTSFLFKKEISTEIIKFQNKGIHVCPDRFITKKEILKKYFYEPVDQLDKAPLKKINKDEEIEEFYRNPDLLAVFLELCRKAMDYLPDDFKLPDILRKNE